MYTLTCVLNSLRTLTMNCLYFSSGQDELAVVSTEVKVYGKDSLGVYSISTFSFFLIFLGVCIIGTGILTVLPTFT